MGKIAVPRINATYIDNLGGPRRLFVSVDWVLDVLFGSAPLAPAVRAALLDHIAESENINVDDVR